MVSVYTFGFGTYITHIISLGISVREIYISVKALKFT